MFYSVASILIDVKSEFLKAMKGIVDPGEKMKVIAQNTLSSVSLPQVI
jgi:GMP synthase PP-ATPase subunit